MLARLVYTSLRAPSCTREEIDSILAAAQQNNHSREVTGVLLYDDKSFIQCLEGDPVGIANLYDNIKADRRHHNVLMVAFGPAARRAFPDWAMGRIDTGSSLIYFHTDLAYSDRSLISNILQGNEVAIDPATQMLQRFVAKGA